MRISDWSSDVCSSDLAWTGLNIDQLRAQGTGWQSVPYWTLIELFGRSSVPLLSIISGWLVMASVSKRDYAQFAGGKAKSLLLPMVAWNLITVGQFGSASGREREWQYV